MRKHMKLIVAIFLALALSQTVFSQQASERVDNWCFAGQWWGNGECQNPDENIELYMWHAGWCAAGIADGILNFKSVEECLNEQYGIVVTDKDWLSTNHVTSKHTGDITGEEEVIDSDSDLDDLESEYEQYQDATVEEEGEFDEEEGGEEE